MNHRLQPLSVLFLTRLRELATNAAGQYPDWRKSKQSDAIVRGPETPPADASVSECQNYYDYGGQLVCETIGRTNLDYLLFMDPRAAIALADQMLKAAESPLTVEQARVIETWRVDLECTYGRVSELAAEVWGTATGQLVGEQLCAEASLLLGRSFDALPR